jgi:hypothetical protein
MRSTGGIRADRMFGGEPMSYGRGSRWCKCGDGGIGMEAVIALIGRD